MFGGPGHDTDYHRSRQPDIAHDGTTQCVAGGASAHAGEWAGLSHLMESSAIRSSYNAPVRTEVIHGMQQTHGNRAVQRAFVGAPVPVQRETYADQWTVPPMDPQDYAESMNQFGGVVADEALYQGGSFADSVANTDRNVGRALGGMGGFGQQSNAAQEQAYRDMVGGVSDFAGDAAIEIFGGTPLGPMLGIPEKKSFLESLPLIGGMAGRGEEMGSSLLNGTMGALDILGQREKPNTRDELLPLSGIPFLGMPDMRALLDHGYEMEGGGTGIGWEAPKEGARPYGYAKVNEPGGQEVGAGLWHDESEIAGIPISTDYVYDVEKQGTFGTDKGDTRYGALHNLGFEKRQFNQGGVVSADAEALTAGYEVSGGTDGFTAGIGANLIAGSISAGKPTEQSHNDEQVRLGLSLGEGFAGRGHWGDKDGDGYKEIGVGADFGIFSADLKTEDPLGTLAKGSVSAIPGANMLLDYFKGDYNMTYGTSMSEDKAAAQEVQSEAWSDRMRAEEEEKYDSQSQIPPITYHIPYQ